LEGDLGLREFTRRWVPERFMIDQKQKRVEESRELLKFLRQDVDADFAHIMTGDESWFFYRYESAARFDRGRTDVVPRVSQMIGSRKTMTSVSFTSTCLMSLDCPPQGQKYN
jgi:hypothetical protein